MNMFILSVFYTLICFPELGAAKCCRCSTIHRMKNKYTCRTGVCITRSECKSVDRNAFIDDLSICGGSKNNDIAVCCPDSTSNGLSKNLRPLKVGERANAARKEYMSRRPLFTVTKVINGSNSPVGSYPHMAGLFYTGSPARKWNCAGSLISKRYVLTAAHCTNSGNISFVRIGRTNLEDMNETIYDDFKIKEIIKHPKYSEVYKYHDIALIRLNKDVDFSTKFIAPAGLYTDFSEDFNGVSLMVSGWGLSSLYYKESYEEMHLRNGTLIVVNQEDCNMKINFFNSKYNSMIQNGITKSQICTKGTTPDMIAPCDGDSGGPIQVVEFDIAFSTIVGVISTSFQCSSRAPNIAMRVTKYLDWIENIVWPLDSEKH